MHTSTISTAALRQAATGNIERLQRDLMDRTTEVATSRKADVGLALGAGAGRSVETRMDRDLLETLQTSNAGAIARLDQTQDALSDLETTASDMLSAAVALPPGVTSARTLEVQAETALDRLADRLNASDGGSYLFGGINTGTAPMTRFDDGPRAAVEAAFQTEFGILPGDPAAATITPAQMETFLANGFADLFDDPDWGATWSSASSTDIVSRIAPSERIATSTNANEAAVRTLAKGFAMIAGLGITDLNEATRAVIVDEARLTLGQGVTEVVALKGRLGFAENAIETANTRMDRASDILARTLSATEGADPTEAKVRIDLLTTQIEMSYALTNQIARLNILNYA